MKKQLFKLISSASLIAALFCSKSNLAQTGAALNFDGSNDMVNLGTSLNPIFTGTNKVTLEAWCNASTTAGNGVIVGNWGNPAASLQFMLRRDANNYTFAVKNISGLQILTSIATVTTGSWVHLAGTWDGSVMRVYVNGLASGTLAVAGNFQSETNPNSIGGRQSGEFFNGSIDEVRIWNRTLCQSEIQNNMMGQLSLPQTSLVAYYQFNQGIAGGANATTTLVTALAGPTGTLAGPFNLTGATSNWVAPGGVSSTVTASPFVNISGPSVVCLGNSAVLTATSSASAMNYTWSTAATTASILISPTVATSYTVAGTNSIGCLGSGIVTVAVNAAPTISVNSGAICSGNSFTITPSGASTYTYSGGSAVVSPTATAAYTVTGTNTVNTCVGSAVSNVTVNALPTVSAASSNTSFICVGSSATLTASGASSYVWNTTATTAVIAVSPTTTTSYTVTGTNAAGCSANAVLTQSVNTCTDIKSTISNLTSNFIVYPNPSNGIFNVQLESAATIEVTDVLGRVILTDNVNAGTYQLNLGNNVNGVYFVKATVDGKTKTVKIVKD